MDCKVYQLWVCVCVRASTHMDRCPDVQSVVQRALADCPFPLVSDALASRPRLYFSYTYMDFVAMWFCRKYSIKGKRYFTSLAREDCTHLKKGLFQGECRLKICNMEQRRPNFKSYEQLQRVRTVIQISCVTTAHRSPLISYYWVSFLKSITCSSVSWESFLRTQMCVLFLHGSSRLFVSDTV